MKFKMVHENYNVLDLDKYMEVYNAAVVIIVKRRIKT